MPMPHWQIVGVLAPLYHAAARCASKRLHLPFTQRARMPLPVPGSSETCLAGRVSLPSTHVRVSQMMMVAQMVAFSPMIFGTPLPPHTRKRP